ncbi:hypothetical protein PtB15_12B57 [Puccinia triticina]|nr:hypothetical protein PtB15_12B57 [Puccinia triticina]
MAPGKTLEIGVNPFAPPLMPGLKPSIKWVTPIIKIPPPSQLDISRANSLLSFLPDRNI